MTEDGPALSIAVPTYNREASLNDLLASIERALSVVERHDVEVVVSDNASTDRTDAVIRNWRARLPLRAYRQSENVGYERNFAALTGLARGRFVWFAGDDDILVEDVLTWLLPLVADAGCDLYVVPAAPVDQPARNTAEHFGLTAPMRAPLGRLLGRFGLFGVLGGVGHAVFRRSGLGHIGRFLDFKSLYVHTFALTASFHDRPAEMSTRTAFLTPVKDAAEADDYARRWRAEDSDNPMGLVRACIALSGLGAIDARPPPSFFKRYYNEPWPIHHLVAHELARRIFFEVYRPDERSWADLDRFFGMLGDARYTAILVEINRSFVDLEATRARMAEPWPDDPGRLGAS
jgi:glycosyltransferase involved in cell wall biosynthesis